MRALVPSLHSRIVVALFVVACASIGFVDEATASTLCRMACKQGGAECKVKATGMPLTVLGSSTYTTVRSCDDAEFEGSGTTILNYMKDRQWFRPPVPVSNPIKEIFKAYPPDACASSTSDCLQARMEGGTRPMTGASGIDPRVAQPAGQGRPCAIGLPCGRIAVPAVAWRFRLVDASLSGSWTVKLVRGKPDPKGDTLVARIDHGVVTADGHWFGPSNRYSYTVADAGGRVTASGEFSVSSQSDMDLLKTISRGKAGVPDGIAWSDTLMENDMTWDAMQESLAETR